MALSELHLHLDGSLRVQTAWELAQAYGLDLNAIHSEADMRRRLEAPADCTSLNEYLARFDIPLQLVKKAEALTRMTRELVEDLAAEGQTYAELRFAPSSSVGEGMTQAQAVEAVILGAEQGMQKCPGIRIGIILCCMRGANNRADSMETIRLTREYLGSIVCAADLAGAEALFPTRDFADIFAYAKRLGVPYTIHAGEADGPESVRAALEMGTMRIGHGILSIRDAELVKELARKGVTLETAVTSNCQTKAVASLAEHPIRRLFDAGVRVTLNTDNRTVSGTTLNKEIQLVKNAFGFTDEEIARMEQYAQEAAFLK